MPKRLSDDQITQYGLDGCTFPVDVFTADEVAGYRKGLEAFEAAQGGPLNGSQRAKGYLLFDWQYEMITHPAVLDAIEDLIGPDILVFYCTAWLKQPDGAGFVSWHQDATYYGLEPAEQVTAWLALSESTPQSGCVRVLPGTHTAGQRPWYREADENNLLTSGGVTKMEIDDSRAIDMTLAPGQMSLHHTHVVHGSNPNTGPERRLGCCASYIPTHVRQTGDCRSGALLVRGEDGYGNFVPETPPVGNADAASAASHAEALALFRASAREKGNQTVDRLG